MVGSKIGKRQLFLLLGTARAAALAGELPNTASAAQVTICAVTLWGICEIILYTRNRRMRDEILSPMHRYPMASFGVLAIVMLSAIQQYRGFLDDSFAENVYQMPLLLLATLLVVLYAVKKGIEGSARFAVLVGGIVVFTGVILMLSNVQNFSAEKLGPVSRVNLKWLSVFADLAFFSELITLGIMTPFVREGITKRDVLRFVQGQAIGIACICIIQEGVLGRSATLLRYPFLKLFSTGGWAFIRQTGVLGLCVWLLVFCIKLIDITEASFIVLRRKNGCEQDKRNYGALLLVFAVAFVCALLMPRASFSQIERIAVTAYLLISVVMVWKKENSAC